MSAAGSGERQLSHSFCCLAKKGLATDPSVFMPAMKEVLREVPDRHMQMLVCPLYAALHMGLHATLYAVQYAYTNSIAASMYMDQKLYDTSIQ